MKRKQSSSARIYNIVSHLCVRSSLGVYFVSYTNVILPVFLFLHKFSISNCIFLSYFNTSYCKFYITKLLVDEVANRSLQ